MTGRQDIDDVLTKITSTRKITLATLNQLDERGYNATAMLGERMGCTGSEIRDQILAGTLDAERAVDALTAGLAGWGR
jgi:hypothetical protein